MDPDKIEVGEIEEIDLRQAFSHESATFTPWLSKPENLKRLGAAVGIELETLSVETSTGTFRTDIVARNLDDDSLVVIENQFSRSDHDHLGKALTYLATKAGDGATTIIWIAERFADEHRAVLDWLNDSTDSAIRFFGVVPKLLRVSGGPPGLRFDVIVSPNEAIKAAKTGSFKISEYIKQTRRAYWPIFTSVLRQDPAFQNCVLRHGGGLGHIHIFPAQEFKDSALQPYVLAFLNLSEDGDDCARVYFRPSGRQTPEEETRTERVSERARTGIQAAGLQEFVAAEMGDEVQMRETAERHIKIVKFWMTALIEVFGPEISY